MLERPSQQTPETRKAPKREPSTARKALAALQASERQLALAQDAAMRQHLLDALKGRHALFQSQGAAEITARYAAQIAAAAGNTAPNELAAAMNQIKLAEASELSRYFLTSQQTLQTETRALGAALSTTAKALRRARNIRHRHERAHLSLLLRSGDRPQRTTRRLPRSLYGKIVQKLAPRGRKLQSLPPMR